jgi:uncharacterized membrane protein (DUF485 family)
VAREQASSIREYRAAGRDTRVSSSNHWIVKSLLISVAIALAVFAVFYGFLMVHQETGITPTSSYKIALAVFVISAIITLIYFRTRASR